MKASFSAWVLGLLFLLTASLAVAEPLAASEDVHSLRVRGVVKALPGKGLARNEILVKHEPIPDYRDESGNVVGMMAMTMPFYLVDSRNLKDIAVGDSVELVVEQRFKPQFTDRVVAITKVPAVAK